MQPPPSLPSTITPSSLRLSSQPAHTSQLVLVAVATLEPQAQLVYTRERIEALLAQRTPGQRLDLRRADLAGLNLAGLDFQDVDLTGANLTGANLQGAAFQDANLTSANFNWAVLHDANLQGAAFQDANFTFADFQGADLRGADLRGANLSGADFQGAKLQGANLTGANLSGADLSGANLSGADLSGANLRRANLSDADLSGANLMTADLSGAVLFDQESHVPSFNNAQVTGTLFGYPDFYHQDKATWFRSLSTLLKKSKGLPLIHGSSIPESLTPSFPCVYYLPGNVTVTADELRRRSFEGQCVGLPLLLRLEAMDPPHVALPNQVVLTAEEQTRPDVVAAVERWAAENPERRINLLPNAQGAVDVTHFYALHRVALDGMLLEHAIMSDDQLKAVSEQPNGMMAIMPHYHTYPEAFKNRIQRVCGNGALWQIWGEIASLPSPQVGDEETAHIKLDMGMGYLSFSPDVATPLPVGYANTTNRSVQNVLSLQSATVIKAREGGESIEWDFSAPMTLLIGILNQAQGKPKAMVTELMRRLKALDGSHDPHQEIKSMLEITKVTAKRKHGDGS